MPDVTFVEPFDIKKGLGKFLEHGFNLGLELGEGRVVRRLLTRKFGVVPDWVEARLKAAPWFQLENWSERVLEAPTLDAVFEDD